MFCFISPVTQINAQTDLALRYNDISPLENHHCAVAFGILSKVPAQLPPAHLASCYRQFILYVFAQVTKHTNPNAERKHLHTADRKSSS